MMGFDILPAEVLENICTHLDTVDILKLRSIEKRMQELSYRNIFRKVRLCSEWFIKRNLFTSFFRTRFSECVTVFDITSVYWIPAGDVRQCIAAMVNLESLYVVDTKVELSTPDLLAYNSLPRLKKLAVGIYSTRFPLDKSLLDVNNYPTLTHLYLYLDCNISKAVMKAILEGFLSKKTIEELWFVEDSGNVPYTVIFRDLPPEGVRRFFISSKHTTHVLFGNKTTIFSTNCCENWFYYDKLYANKSGLHELEGLDECWRSLLMLRGHSCPFNLPQAKQLFDGAQFSAMNFSEINLMHADIKCGDQHEKLVATVLVAETMRNLKKLAVNYCCCLGKPAKARRNVSIFDPDQDPEPKRSKVEKPDNPFLLERIVENSPLIEELELWTCQRAVNNAKMLDVVLEPIAKLKNLKRLLLDNIPRTINGSFLKTVCNKCVNLRSLSIKCAQQNSRLHIAVCKVLESMTELRDFRYQVPAISYDRLFDSLLENDRLKLQRVYIESEFVETVDHGKLRLFLFPNRQLRFFQIVANEVTATKLKSLNSSLAEFKESGWRFLAVTKEPWTQERRAPLIYRQEMIKYGPRVSAVDSLRDFQSYSLPSPPIGYSTGT